ncbi:unnamed protein product [Callosobruchus maculatus]|uniref:Rel homology dimerisation domain-containing protein n=1 Tax=Callosobruchus maculatus TaxID=64391 RepID=A0A653CI83_CALMS|nr:unnamed protein product [Callosobruchus maculatus]
MRTVTFNGKKTHFVCVVPPYHRPDITKPISVRLCVVSSGKTSESHHFVYTPVNGTVASGAGPPATVICQPAEPKSAVRPSRACLRSLCSQVLFW